jgi:hypothetical protein
MNATETTTDVRAQFHELFGTTDTDVSEYGKYADDAEQFSIGDDDCVMWIPDTETLPLGIPVAEFSTIENTAYAVGDVSDTDDFPDDQVELVVFQSDGKEHAVQLEYVAKAAQLAETHIEGITENARIHTEYAHYPPMIPLENGRLLIAPFVGEYEYVGE